MPYQKGGGRMCVVVDCNNNQRRLYEWKTSVCEEHQIPTENCPCLQPFSMHRFPKDAERRQAWVRAVNGKDYTPKSHDQVCSSHFLDGRPTKLNPDPVLNLGYEKTAKPGRRALTRIPLTPVKTTDNITDLTSLREVQCEEENDCAEINTNADSSSPSSTACQTEDVICHLASEPCPSVEVRKTCDAGTQTDDFVVIEHCYSMIGSKKSVGTQHTSVFGVNNITNDSESRFNTGLTLTVFLAVVNCMSQFGKKLPYKLPVPDQILLTIMRLRLGLAFQDLGNRFGVSFQLCSDIFNSWISIMDKHLKNCILWLPRKTIKRTLPSSFANLYPKTTCVIDCTEVFIHRPFSLKARAQTYSTYKGHNTAKVLVAIAPNGYIMFVSHSYGGRASDNFITKSCGFLNVLRPGDEVMADRGFTIGEELFARRVKLNIPSFMKGRTQLSEKETVESRRIASVRIHVERAIARLKNYRILNTTVPVNSLRNLDKIVNVCAALCNLHGDLIKENSVY